MSCLPKPVLKGHAIRKGVKILAQTFLVASFNCTMVYIFRKLPIVNSYEEFQRTYDEDAFFADLDRWGYMNYKKILGEVYGTKQ